MGCKSFRGFVEAYRVLEKRNSGTRIWRLHKGGINQKENPMRIFLFNLKSHTLIFIEFLQNSAKVRAYFSANFLKKSVFSRMNRSPRFSNAVHSQHHVNLRWPILRLILNSCSTSYHPIRLHVRHHHSFSSRPLDLHWKPDLRQRPRANGFRLSLQAG